MGRVERYPAGTFCWVELAAPDLAAAQRFYGGVFGWTFEPAGGSTVAMLDGAIVAGLHQLDGEDPTGWSSTVAVDDVAIAIDRARTLGAEADATGDSIATGTATVRDPTGALLALRPADQVPVPQLVNEIGTWSWNELVSPDLDVSAEFYGGLLGWTTSDVNAPTPRRAFTKGDRLIAGGHAPTLGEPDDPRWEVSFRVADPDASAALVTSLGGQVRLPPMDIPIGRFTIVADPFGAAMTLTKFDGPTRGADGL